MRAPARRRPLKRRFTDEPGSTQYREDLAAAATYVGSPEHKATPSFAGAMPRPRPDASLCDAALANQKVLIDEWLAQAIRRGQFSSFVEGKYPRYIWHRVEHTMYEARLVNREQGSYKGYPLQPDEWPEGSDLS